MLTYPLLDPYINNKIQWNLDQIIKIFFQEKEYQSSKFIMWLVDLWVHQSDQIWLTGNVHSVPRAIVGIRAQIQYEDAILPV